MARRIREERGSITLLTLGMLGVMTLLFSVLLNLVKVYAVKEEASNVAEQASLVVTSGIYETLRLTIEEVDDSLIGLLCAPEFDPWPKKISEQINERYHEINGHYPDLSVRELYLEAMNQVLSDRLQQPSYGCLKDKIEHNLLHARASIKQAALDTIAAGGGEASGAEMKINNRNRVEIKASSVYEAITLDQWIPDDRRKINQVGVGPEIRFLEHINWSL